MLQVDLINMKPLPPPPPPEPNVFIYRKYVTMVEEYYDEDEVLHERPHKKEIFIEKIYCEYAEFSPSGYCHGGCTTDADTAYCMKLSEITNKADQDD